MRYHFEITGDVLTDSFENAWDSARDALAKPERVENLSVAIAQVPEPKRVGFTVTDG